MQFSRQIVEDGKADYMSGVRFHKWATDIFLPFKRLRIFNREGLVQIPFANIASPSKNKAILV